MSASGNRSKEHTDMTEAVGQRLPEGMAAGKKDNSML